MSYIKCIKNRNSQGEIQALELDKFYKIIEYDFVGYLIEDEQGIKEYYDASYFEESFFNN